MKAITFKSNSERKIHLLAEIAKEMGVEMHAVSELSDEEMALPGTKPSKQQLEEWLAKEDGEAYGIEEAFAAVKKELAKPVKKKR